MQNQRESTQVQDYSKTLTEVRICDILLADRIYNTHQELRLVAVWQCWNNNGEGSWKYPAKFCHEAILLIATGTSHLFHCACFSRGHW
jgi:hypothetical protein